MEVIQSMTLEPNLLPHSLFFWIRWTQFGCALTASRWITDYALPHPTVFSTPNRVTDKIISATHKEDSEMLQSIPADLKEFVEAEVASGNFPTEEEAVAEGIRLLRRRAEFRKELQIGAEQIERGEMVTIHDKEESNAYREQLKQNLNRILHGARDWSALFDT
jgi:Arc/MetJ-type ribon-helix-helix transcriptional regulator